MHAGWWKCNDQQLTRLLRWACRNLFYNHPPKKNRAAVLSQNCHCITTVVVNSVTVNGKSHKTWRIRFLSSLTYSPDTGYFCSTSSPSPHFSAELHSHHLADCSIFGSRQLQHKSNFVCIYEQEVSRWI